MLTFRCDDVSINTNLPKLESITHSLFENFPDCRVIYGISVAVHEMGKYTLESERIFPKILNAYSDHRVFYNVDKIGIPEVIDSRVIVATHGLIHVDHRLLPYQCQEMSILVSSSLLKSKVFIPPFNKYNLDTQNICDEYGIELVKWEDDWKHLSYHPIGRKGKYYFHTHDMNLYDFNKVLSNISNDPGDSPA